MGSLPTGSDKILEIRSAEVTVTLKSKNTRPPFTGTPEKPSVLTVSGTEIEYLRILGEETVCEDGPFAVSYSLPVEPLFFEQTDYEIVVQSRNGQAVSVWHENYGIRDKIGKVTDSDALVSGIINFGNNIGFSDFEIRIGGRHVLTVRVEVYPTKISYKEDYRAIMEDVTSEIYAVAFDFLKKTYQSMRISDTERATPAEFFQIISIIFGDFVKAANKITAVPHHKLVTTHEVQPWHKVRRTDGSTRQWLMKHPSCTVRSGNGFVAEKALAVRKEITYDTVENRFAKYILQSTVKRLTDFKNRYEKSNNPDAEVLASANRMQQTVNRLLGSTFFLSVGAYGNENSMSLVFELAPGYRELYKYYLMLRRGLEIHGDLFRISMKDTAQLYEYWCFLKLVSMMKNTVFTNGDGERVRKYQLTSPDVIRMDRSGITVTLVKGRKSEIKFINVVTGERISLIYNPGEQNTQTVSQKPDNVLTLEKKGSDVTYKYIFDAKYRIETNPDSYYPDKKPGPKLDDINTMHRYRDSIVYENTVPSRFTFEKTMFGAYVLFPYADEEEYKNHRFYRSIETVNIGGLPFLPGATQLVGKLLEDLISDSADSAFERATLPAGTEEKLAKVDWTVKDVLIGSVRNESQYDYCIQNLFYYVPADQIPEDRFPIRYVAMYLSRRASRPGIHCYGTVIRTEKVRRKDISFPSPNPHQDRLYYRFTVKEWTRLKESIVYRDDRVYQPRFTNLFLLENSSETYELFNIHSEEQYRLLTEMKRAFSGFAMDTQQDEPVFRINEKRTIWAHEGCFELVNETGEVIGQFSFESFKSSPRRTFERMKETI